MTTSLEKAVQNATLEDQSTLKSLIHSFAQTIEENRQLKEKIDVMAHDLRLMRKKIYGSNSEKITTNLPVQMTLPLFNETELCAHTIEQHEPVSVEAESHSTPKNNPPKKKRTRRPLPRTLPRQIVEHDLDEAEKNCICGQPLTCLGHKVSETLDYQPAKLVVIEHRRKQYACQPCNQAHKKNPELPSTLKTASRPATLLPKSMASPSLLAHLIVQKFCYHLPLYRQTQQFAALGITLSRQVMSQWLLSVSEKTVPLVNLLQDQVLAYDVAFADETTLQVLHEPSRPPQTRSYMWCFLGGPPQRRVIIYQYHETRKGAIATDFFEGYQGALHCDAYGGYDALLRQPTIVGINCWAHARRKFMEALPNGKMKGIAAHVLRDLQKLYKLERELKDDNATPAQRQAAREKNARPLLERINAFLLEKEKTVLPQSPVGKAIAYTLKRWPYLTTYTQDGRYEIDNNRAERAIKPFVIGRKNWLFANTPAGAHASARLFTLIETAKANGLEPQRYLEHIFKKLPDCSTVEGYEALLPWRVKGEWEKCSL